MIPKGGWTKKVNNAQQIWWDNFTDEQKKKIRENYTPDVLGPALHNVRLGQWDRFRVACNAFLKSWRAW